MDFEDSVLHDDSWALAQPYGTYVELVRPKSDSGADNLLLAVGEGRNGGNALLVESTNSSMGLPGFFLIKGRTDHGWIANPNNSERYFLPRGRRVNRLEFWVRFEQGYRYNKASAQPPAWPNHENMHFGTYHDDPVIPGTDPESHNWHFYHKLWLRHDLAGTNWIHVVLNEQAQHQRSLTAPPCVNPTRPTGNYWELLTRFYIDGHAYFSDPEIPYPVKMWVDDIKLTYVPEPNDIEVSIENYIPGEKIVSDVSTTNDLTITIRNRRDTAITGLLSSTTPYWLNPEILETATQTTAPATVTVDALSATNFILRIVPNSNLATGRTDSAGFMFVPTNQFVSGTTYANRSFSDANLEKRWFPEQGPHDAVVYGTHIRVEVGVPSTTNIPTLLGGQHFWTTQGRSFQDRLQVHNPNAQPFSLVITAQDHTNVVLNSSSGDFLFAPDNSFTGIYAFSCMDNTGSAGTNNVEYWIHTVPDTDLDTLPDAWEYNNFSNLLYGATDDPDGDHCTNYRELLTGTDPADSLSFWQMFIEPRPSSIRFSVTAHAADDAGLTGLTRHVGIYETADLMSPVWSAVPGYDNIPATNQLITYTCKTNTSTRFFIMKSWLK